MWDLDEFLSPRRHQIAANSDSCYSQPVFDALLREGRIDVTDLHGLSKEKLSTVQQIKSL